MSKCYKCNRELISDETALYKKTVDRMAEEFLCIDCLAERFDTTRDELQKMIKSGAFDTSKNNKSIFKKE